MAKYRKKPVVIEAVQYDGSNFQEVISFGNGDVNHNSYLGGDENANGYVQNYDKIFIPTLEGEMTVSVNDWIIKGVNGEYYPCKPDIFKKTYEKVEAEEEPQGREEQKFYAVEFAGYWQIKTKPFYDAGENILDAEDVGNEQAEKNANLIVNLLNNHNGTP